MILLVQEGGDGAGRSGVVPDVSVKFPLCHFIQIPSDGLNLKRVQLMKSLKRLYFTRKFCVKNYGDETITKFVENSHGHSIKS